MVPHTPPVNSARLTLHMVGRVTLLAVSWEINGTTTRGTLAPLAKVPPFAPLPSLAPLPPFPPYLRFTTLVLLPVPVGLVFRHGSPGGPHHPPHASQR